jgi:hypothetical protein
MLPIGHIEMFTMVDNIKIVAIAIKPANEMAPIGAKP